MKNNLKEKENTNPKAVTADELKGNKSDKDFKLNKFGKKGKFRKRGKDKGGKEVNDPSWHTKNEQLVKDTASLPFNNVVGNLLRSATTKLEGLPIIFSTWFDWTVGLATQMKDAINSAAAQIWQFIRSYNSGSTNYEAADVLMYIMGSLDIMSTLQWLIRPFGVYGYYSDRNREVPRILFNEMGIDYDDFINNIAKYRGILNTLLIKASSLVIPKEYPIFDQVMAMTKDIYKDEDSDTGREQLYLINKLVFHNFDPTASPQGGLIELFDDGEVRASAPGNRMITTRTDWTNGQAMPKYQVYLDILENQLEAIILDEDCNIIAGDILKAYDRKSSEFWHFSPIDETYKLEPTYSDEFKMMMHNAEIIPLPNGTENVVSDGTLVITNNENVSVLKAVGTHEAYNNNINQNGNLISTNHFFYWPSNTVNVSRFEQPRLLDTRDMNPSAIDNMLRTRWKNRYHGTPSATPGDNTTKFEPVALSSIVLFGARITINVKDGTSPESYEQYNIATSIQTSSRQLTAQDTKGVATLTAFDLHPIVYLEELNAGSGGVVESHPLGERNNVIYINTDDLANIHQIDFLSLFNIPFNR